MVEVCRCLKVLAEALESFFLFSALAQTGTSWADKAYLIRKPNPQHQAWCLTRSGKYVIVLKALE